MTDRPIIMSAPMVRALLAGRKTQTRLILKPQPHREGLFWHWHGGAWGTGSPALVPGHSMYERAPAKPGDRLWVREKWAVTRYTLDYETGGEEDHFEWSNEYGDPRQYLNGSARFGTCASLHYAADGEERNPCGFYPVKAIDGRTILRHAEIPWRSSSAMPRWASRLTLDVTDVRVQRLHDISDDDALAEGCVRRGDTAFADWSCLNDRIGYERPVLAFAALWRALHKAPSAETDAWAENPWVAALSFTVRHSNIDAPSPTPQVRRGGDRAGVA